MQIYDLISFFHCRFLIKTKTTGWAATRGPFSSHKLKSLENETLYSIWAFVDILNYLVRRLKIYP